MLFYWESSSVPFTRCGLEAQRASAISHLCHNDIASIIWVLQTRDSWARSVHIRVIIVNVQSDCVLSPGYKGLSWNYRRCLIDALNSHQSWLRWFPGYDVALNALHGRMGSLLLLLVKVALGLQLALFIRLFTTNSVSAIAQGQDPVISLRVLRRPSIDNFLWLVFKDNFNFDNVWRWRH